MEFPDVVELNVGGRHVSTFLSTLTKYPDSMLAAMFSGRHSMTRDKDGRFFIDADGDVFIHLLNFLRFGTMPPSDKANQVKQYAEYFGIDEMKQRLSCIILPKLDELVAKWKSDIPGYAGSLSSVKEHLLTGKIDDGYINLVVKNKSCYEHYCQPPNVDYPEHLSGIVCSELQVKVHTDFDVNQKAATLFTLLSHDLKQGGLCTEMEPTRRRCCYYEKILKVL